MNIYKSNLFKYIAGDSLVGKSVSMTIDRVVMEEIEGQGGKKEDKPVLYFAESKKGMVLNKTNAKRIGKLFGAETDDWKGKAIELYAESVKAFGETHNAVRVREAKIQAITDRVKAEKLTPNERKARRADNPLRLIEDEPIGETQASNGDWQRFAERVIREVPFFVNYAEVKAALEMHSLTYSPENEEMLISELAKNANQQADLKAA